MRNRTLFALFLLAITSIVAVHCSNEDHQKRIDTQDAILTQLQSLNDETVTEFINDWRDYITNPSSKDISELKIIQQRINNDVKNARKFTNKAHLECIEDICKARRGGSIISWLSGDTCTVKPGL